MHARALCGSFAASARQRWGGASTAPLPPSKPASCRRRMGTRRSTRPSSAWSVRWRTLVPNALRRIVVLGSSVVLTACGPSLQPTPTDPPIVWRRDTLIPPADTADMRDTVWRIPAPVDSLPMASGRLVRVALSSGVPAVEIGATGDCRLVDQDGGGVL